jgi:hypothetical protein
MLREHGEAVSLSARAPIQKMMQPEMAKTARLMCCRTPSSVSPESDRINGGMTKNAVITMGHTK